MFNICPGTNESIIIKELSKHSNDQRQQIALAFKTAYGKVFFLCIIAFMLENIYVCDYLIDKERKRIKVKKGESFLCVCLCDRI